MRDRRKQNMMKRSMCLFMVSGLIAMSGCGSSASSPNYGATTTPTPGSTTTTTGRNSSAIGTSGGHLVDADGYTLYESASSCTGGCLTVWPPFDASQNPSVTGSASAASIGLQSGQVTYNGELLYYFDTDTAPGQTNGSGVGGFTLVSP
jgi:predicted lipoprotein with Yx(FWY)xxD motif